MNKTLTRLALSLVAVASLAWGTAHAKAQSDGVAPAKVKKHSKNSTAKKAAKKTAKPVFIPGSEETVAQRSARLSRECKGGVNAGACAGYTR